MHPKSFTNTEKGSPGQTSSRFKTVFLNNYTALRNLIPLLSPAELRALFTPAELQSMKDVIDRLLSPIRCLGPPANEISRLLQEGYQVLLLGKDVRWFDEMMRNPYDSWIKPGVGPYLMWGDDEPRLLQLIVWAWKPRGQHRGTLPPWQKVAHTYTDRFGEVTEVLEPQATCGFQPMRLDDGQAISVKYPQAKVNTCETDTVCLFIGECSRAKDHDHIMRMKMCNSDKFLSYVKGCAETRVLDLNQESSQSESYDECKISDSYPRPTGPFLCCQFHLPQYPEQPANFFINPDSKWGLLQSLE